MESVSLDALVAADSTTATTTPDRPQNTLLPTLGLPTDKLAGKGVGIAVIDSGLQPSKEFSGVLQYFYDFTTGQTTPYDDYGHGTHVTGLISSSGVLSNGTYQGIAPKARIISLKVLDANGTGQTSTVIQAIEFAVTNKSRLGIDIINLSLGHPSLEPPERDPLVRAVEGAVRAGIVVVVSAGNSGKDDATGLPAYGTINSPGTAPSAITIGAVDTKNTTTRADDTIPSFSSHGPTIDGRMKPDLVAPGHKLV